ncbi:hypothetical protein BO94DRAFT_576099 [Aspergillus sclerotioniger CBS 115572]|uniref:Bacteriophage T5 Orf172 DNA-binding domain-containing protein n=1 Tax=Aspergillus sclerotioniger CBS 115572 TaxID=1450535 RepID=A0A317WAV1_9EURO|nr:hypothetical protein BO94DRAFT_576099 [Aspergillus sclerotioniger CBS 115572]PWY83646.1 hypothetical protein BO94DRAFT_576099 [Aspergillus sclerotioniger CBS 115572]
MLTPQYSTAIPSRASLSSPRLPLDDGERTSDSPSPNVASVARGADRPANPRDERAYSRPAARCDTRQQTTTASSSTKSERTGQPSSSNDRTIQRYLRNTANVDQTIVCLEQILSGTAFPTPRPCDPPNPSTNPASETLSTSRTGDTAQAASRREKDDAPFATEDIILENRNIMTREYKEENRGCAYIYQDCKDKSQYFKIGSTDRIQARERELQNQCKHIGWELIPEPKFPIWQYKRLERLARSELKGLRYDPNCVCSTKHRQYFRGSNATASEVLEHWSRWFVNHEPYDKENRLKPFWVERLETFTTNKNGLVYFDCHGNKCSRRESKSIACQECLRAGWKAWTEPTILEKAGYVCQTFIRTLGQHSPVPTYLLGIVGGRLLIPIMLVLLQGLEVSFRTVFDFSICICT